MFVKNVPPAHFLAHHTLFDHVLLNLVFFTILKLKFSSSFLLRGMLVEIVPLVHFLAQHTLFDHVLLNLVFLLF